MTRLRLALAAFLAAGLLSACQDDDPEPKVADPTPSASPATTETSTQSAATPTQAAPPLNAVETVRAWIEARNAALSTGDTSAVDALSSSQCRSCEELNGSIRDVYAAGGEFDTDGWTIKSIQEKQGASPPQVDTALIFAAGQTVPSAGAQPVSYNEEKHIVTFKLSESGAGFVVRLVLFLS